MRATVVEHPVGQSRFVDDFFNDSFFRSGGFFAKKVPKLLSSPPIEITVKSLPKKGRPEDFEGAVGDFHFQAGIDKRSVRQYEPVVLEMVIDGREPPQSYVHAIYSTLELTKLGILFVTGFVALSDQK